MKVNFSKEESDQLSVLIVKFVLENVCFNVQKTGINLSPQQVINDCTLNTIEVLASQFQSKLKQKTESDFVASALGSTILAKQEIQDISDNIEFLKLVYKRKVSLKNQKDNEVKLNKLEKEFEQLKLQSMSPEEVMDKKRKEIEELKQILN